MTKSLEKLANEANVLSRMYNAVKKAKNYAIFVLPVVGFSACCGGSGDNYRKPEIYQNPPAITINEDSNLDNAFNINDYIRGNVESVSFFSNNVGCEPDQNGNEQCYTKTKDWNGKETGILTVKGERGEQQVANIDVTVNPVNDVPVLTNINGVNPSTDGKVYLGNLSAGQILSFAYNATDVENDLLSFKLYDSQGNELSLEQRFIEGTHNLKAEVDDGNGGKSLTDIVLTVSAGTPPTFTNMPDKITATEGTSYSLDLDAQDSYGNTLTYSLLSAPTGITIDGNTGQLSWQNPAVGSYTVTVKIDNGFGGVNTQNLELTAYNAVSDYFDDTYDDNVDPSEEYGMKLSNSVWENNFRSQLSLGLTPFGYSLQDVYLDVSYNPVTDKFTANSGNILQRLSTTKSLQVDREGNNNGTIDGLLIVDQVLLQSVLNTYLGQ